MMKTFYVLISMSLLFFLGGCIHENRKATHPNIIYVLADDLGYGDISAFNEEGKIFTPNIDQMASEGMKFTDAHTSSAVCTPTRYGILTGRYNWRTRLKRGVLNGRSRALIPADRTTVAAMLKTQGYQTAFIGKWHLGWDWAINDSGNIDFSLPITNSPNERGFDYAFGHSGSLDMEPYVYVENGLATEVPDSITENTGEYTWWRKGPTARDFIHEDVTPGFFRRAIAYIGEHGLDENPFFLYLALPSPHTPILPTEEWQGKSKLNPYGDFVLMVDNYMGLLLKAIEDAGIEENTLIIFTSDNGCSPEANFKLLAERGHRPSAMFRGHKADIFEGGHRVPFIAKWPDRIEKGSVSDEVICTTDLMATCADIVGYTLPDNEGEDSYSLVPVFEQVRLGHPLREATVHHSINGSFAIRKGDWKLIMCPGSGGWSYPRPGRDQKVLDSLPGIQLYNLKEDPGETDNLRSMHEDKVEELKTLLLKYVNEGRSTPGTPQKNDPYDKEWKQIDF